MQVFRLGGMTELAGAPGQAGQRIRFARHTADLAGNVQCLLMA